MAKDSVKGKDNVTYQDPCGLVSCVTPPAVLAPVAFAVCTAFVGPDLAVVLELGPACAFAAAFAGSAQSPLYHD